MDWTLLLYVLSALLIIAGIAGTILPAIPGVPLVFAGMFLTAWADDFQYIGWMMLAVLAAIAVLSLVVDFVAGLLGAQRVGASRWALVGAALGTIVGIFFGIIGLLLGPFVGALIGELVAGGTLRRATEVGTGAWIGYLVGSVLKIALAFLMVGIFAMALLF
jgi:uncharacterized protein YqgC (DUF456 family)